MLLRSSYLVKRQNFDKISFKELLELLLEKLDQNDVKELLLSKEANNRTFLHFLCRYNDKTQLKELLELLLKKLNQINFIELFS